MSIWWGKGFFKGLYLLNQRVWEEVSIMKKIPAKGEKVRLTNVGNSDQGGIYVDRPDLITDELLRAIERVVESTGYNYGRFDLKARSFWDFKKGDFQIIEVNGIDSISINFYDKKYNFFQSVSIMNKQLDKLYKVSKENKEQDIEMDMPNFKKFWKRLKQEEAILEENHQVAIRFR